jgi:hypothetical protein
MSFTSFKRIMSLWFPGLVLSCTVALLAKSADGTSAYIHGTIDVIVSTSEGFVLATDSRATRQENDSHGNPVTKHSDDEQKVFPIGDRTVCVIAGLVGSEIGADGFRLRDAIGSHLVFLDHQVRSSGTPVDAQIVARAFESSFDGVVGIMRPDVGIAPGIVGEIGVVSLDREAAPEWMTLYFPLKMTADELGRTYLTTDQPFRIGHSVSLGLRFDIDCLGQPSVVANLVRREEPGEDRFSRSEIMCKFYRLKRERHLDEFSLQDGVELAELLVNATIALSPPDAGVGGPVDVVTLSKDGVNWVRRKQIMSFFPPRNRVRYINTKFTGPGRAVDLDGIECLRCVFVNADLRYSGEGDVQLLNCTFEGHPKLTLARGARRKMPVTVNSLTRLLASKYEIVEEK